MSRRRAPTQSVNSSICPGHRPWLEPLEGRDLPALFGPSLVVSVGDDPRWVAVGDFNLDGIADLAIVNRLSGTVSVLLASGTGAFSAAAGSPILVGDVPQSVAVGDFNRDGIPDLAVANRSDGTVSVLLGSGTGAFSAAPGSPAPVGGPLSVAVGDFNLDGIPDLAFANLFSDTVSVLLGSGTGAFSAAAGSPILVGDGPQFVAVGDFNRDGTPDLAVANRLSATVSVLLGNGTGAFSAAAGSPILVGDGPQSVAVGDFNRDGIPDLAVANSGDDTVSVLLGSGTGAFSAAPGSPVPVGDGPISVAVGDFNRDGISDLAVSNLIGDTVSVLLNQGATTTVLVSSAATALYGQPTTFTATVTAASGNPTGTVTFRDGTTVLGTVPLDPDGTATFTPAVPLPAGTHTIATTFNGSLEFVTSSAAITQTVNLTPTTTILTASTPQITAGDTITLTAVVQSGTTGTPSGSVTFYDGGSVLGTAPLSSGIAVLPTATLGVGAHSVFALYASDGNYLGSASGVATVEVVSVPPPPPPPPPPPVTAFAAGTDSGGGQVNLYNADGSSRGSAAPFGAGFTGGVRVAVGDVTGDGVPDLVAGTGPGAAAKVVVIDGKAGVSRVLAPFESFTGGVFVAAGDLTGDGIADVVVTPDQSGGPRVMIYRGGDLQPVASFFGIDDPSFRGGARAAVGDINDDGSPDLVVSAGFGGGPRVSVFDGAALARGQFDHPVADFFLFDDSLRNGVFLAVGDVEGDGFGDIVAGAGPGGSPRVLAVSGRVLLSDGAAVAVADPLVNFFAGDTSGRGGARVAVADLDSDARSDLVVGNGEGAGSRVTSYLGKNFVGGAVPEFSFEAFPGFTGGVFVG